MALLVEQRQSMLPLEVPLLMMSSIVHPHLRLIKPHSKSDGPGAFDFVQGDNSSVAQNPFWQMVKGIFI